MLQLRMRTLCRNNFGNNRMRKESGIIPQNKTFNAKHFWREIWKNSMIFENIS